MTLDSKTYLRVSVHDIKIVELDCCQIPEHLSSLPNFVWVRVAQLFSFLCSILSTILLLIVPFFLSLFCLSCLNYDFCLYTFSMFKLLLLQ